MPRPGLPPTPASSTDIKGQSGTFINTHQTGFELPPSAIGSRSNSAASQEETYPGKDTAAPDSPESKIASPRKRSHGQAATDGSLPPPPGRSRKIIQVKPREQQAKRQSIDDADYEPGSKSSSTATTKKKGQTTSAGRKIARKTAHSLIERRRRSKMNEEFGVLKDMIPACHGQEMHKLAILQASIEYLRYLEQCITELKSDARRSHAAHPLRCEASPESGAIETGSSQVEEDEDEEDEDEEMLDTTIPQATSHPQHGASKPSGYPDAVTRFPAQSTTLPSFVDYRDQRHYSQASSEAPSPFMTAQNGTSREWSSTRPGSRASYPASPTIYSNQTSPMLLPQPQTSELDREASAALLMLNATDRRTSTSLPSKALAEARAGSVKGISVKDLLSA